MSLSAKNKRAVALPSNHFYHDLMNGLMDRLDYIRIQPACVLNYGLHVAHSHAQLSKRYPDAAIIDVNSLSALKKMPNESVDLVFAHFPLLLEDPLEILGQFARLLRENGLLMFTSLGPDTLYELRESFSVVDMASSIGEFVDMHHIGDWLKASHFADPVVDREMFTIAYDDLPQLFVDLKQLRLFHYYQSSQGLVSKERWQKMQLHYEGLKSDGYYPSTLELIFGHGWKVKRDSFGEQGEFVVSLDQIRRK